MTSLEFSNSFDIRYNNIMSNQSPGLDEYEKSVVLSAAELELVKNTFNPKGNKYQEGYDDSAKRQYDFSTITEIKRYTKGFSHYDILGNETQEEDLNEINFREILQYAGDLQDYIGMDKTSVFPMRTRDINVHRYKYTLPKDFMYFISEEAELERLINGRKVYRNAIVTPINYNQLTMLRGSTYKFPVQNECWRVLNKREITTDAEILTPYASEIVNYAMRYVRKPKPIILINIGNIYGTTIDGEWGEGLPDDISDAQVCELPEAMHDEIVQRAVEIAKATYRTGETEALINIGQRTE